MIPLHTSERQRCLRKTSVRRAANAGTFRKDEVFVSLVKDSPPPTEVEEYRNTTEILRDLAAQVRFDDTRNALVSFATLICWPHMLRVKSPGRSTGRPREQRPRHSPSIRTANNNSTLGQFPGSTEEESSSVASRCQRRSAPVVGGKRRSVGKWQKYRRR